MSYRVLKIQLILFLIFIFSACRPHLTVGTYEGTLTQIDDLKLTRIPVSMNVSSQKRHTASIIIKDIQQKTVASADVSWSGIHNILSLSLSSLSPHPFKLSPIKTKRDGDIDWHCYEGSNTFAMSACFNRHEFIINVTNLKTRDVVFSLTGDFAPQQSPFVLETPGDYTLSKAIDRVQSKSFESMIEYQRVVAARHAARAAYLNLLPHFNYKTALAASALNPAALYSFVADFVPFVIPTRWLKVMEARAMREAEKTTLDILRAELTNQISGISYNYVRDLMDYNAYDDMIQKSKKVLKHIHQIGNINEGVLDELHLRLSWVNNLMEQEYIRLENAIAVDKTALALSMGFHNPQAINNFDIEESVSSIETAKELVKEDVARMATSRSLEVRQINYLIHNAHLQKDQYYFNWSDPDVPSSSSVSTSVIAHAARAKAYMKELMIVREQKQSQIGQRAINAVLNYNYSLQSYWKTIEGYRLAKDRLDWIYNDVLSAKKPEDIHTIGPNAQWVLQAYIQSFVKLHSVIAIYRISRAEIQRVLLEGYYSRLQPRAEGDLPSLD